MLESMWTRSDTSKMKPMHVMPYTESIEPSWVCDCNSRKLPRFKESNTSAADSTLVRPKSGKRGSEQPGPLSNDKDSKCTKSSTDNERPDQASPSADSRESDLQKDLEDEELPIITWSKAEGVGSDWETPKTNNTRPKQTKVRVNNKNSRVAGSRIERLKPGRIMPQTDKPKPIWENPRRNGPEPMVRWSRADTEVNQLIPYVDRADPMRMRLRREGKGSN